MTTSETERSAFAPLADALKDVRAAGERLREAQQAAWKQYLTEIDRALAADLGGSEEADSEDGPAAAQALLDAVRGRLDDMRVQARLGLMEGEDLLEELRSVLGDVVDRVRAPLR
jgi:hypothetical protein